MSIKILHEDCDPTLAENKSLPYTAYIITYLEKDDTGSLKSKYDIAVANKKVDIFDYYWDRHKNNLKDIVQTKGNINPKLWGNTTKEQKKKK